MGADAGRLRLAAMVAAGMDKQIKLIPFPTGGNREADGLRAMAQAAGKSGEAAYKELLDAYAAAQTDDLIRATGKRPEQLADEPAAVEEASKAGKAQVTEVLRSHAPERHQLNGKPVRLLSWVLYPRTARLTCRRLTSPPAPLPCGRMTTIGIR